MLYGDTVDGAWYFQLMRDGTAISDFRENVLFGQAHIGDSGTAGADAVTLLPDLEFLDAHTEGFGAALRFAKESAASIPAVASACGLAEEDVLEFYRWFARTPRTVTAFSQGVNQSTSGTDKVNAIVNVHLATGRIGKPGTGPFSITGQPNAMGGREVGGLANQLAAHMDFAPAHVERVGRFWGAPRIATKPGLKAVDCSMPSSAAPIKALWIMATNPVVSMPDAERVRRALGGAPLVVVSDCVRDTDTTRCAHVLLPAAAWGEKSGTVTNSERRISRQRAFLPVPGEARPDWWIVTEVARRMGFGGAFAYDSPAAIFREHARLSAFENDGARDFDLGGVVNSATPSTTRSRRSNGRARRARGSGAAVRRRQVLHAEPQGAVDSHAAAAVGGQPSRDYPLVLNTGRVRDQWHTMTRTGKSARLGGTTPSRSSRCTPSMPRASGSRSAISLRSERRGAHRRAGRDHGHGRARRGVRADALGQRVRERRARRGADRVGRRPGLRAARAQGAPVRVRRYEPKWYGFALSRAPLDVPPHSYRALSRGPGYWRYELAGEEVPASWSEWADRVLGSRAARIEFSRRRGRALPRRQRGRRALAGVPVRRDDEVAAVAHLARDVVRARELADADRLAILAGRAPKGGVETGPIVCSCFAVGRSTLLRAIRGDKLVSVEAIGKALHAGTNCGSCIPELKGLLAESSASAPAPA